MLRSLVMSFSVLLVAASIGAAIPPQERVALLALYDSTNGGGWNDATGWLGDPGTECNWSGVTCDDAGEHVTDIYLEENNLTGVLPPELGNLTRLDTLSLIRGAIGGSIPSSLGTLPDLRALNLYLNQLSGEIPPELGNLGSLEALNLLANDLEGEIPEQLGNLVNLNVLDLAGNRLSGSIPSDLERLSLLEQLNLEQNELTGSLPSGLGDLSNLVTLRLGDNQLTGSIPGSFGDLISLEELNLERNRLTGPIPGSLGNVQSLRSLDLAGNDLNGQIPASLGDAGSLEALFLFDNDLGGTIPPALGNLTNLIVLDLSAARLTGPIPVELASLPALEVLTLGQFYDFGPRNNRLTGGVPSELSRLATLRSLELGFNDLGGTIPSALGDLENLERLDLSANGLTGPIPSELGRLSKLERLTLAFNSLTGSLPVELGQLGALTGMDLQVNQLAGSLPPQLGNLTSLIDLYLNENDFSGPIPAELGNLHDLETLYLHGNRLTGPIPATFSNLTKLGSLQLFGNDLDGPIPPWLGNLTNLRDLLLDGNRFTGPIPPQITNLTSLSSFGVGGNRLSGGLPSDIGKLVEMQYLSLNGAGLGGELPQSLWKMTQLIDARLEDNDFSGSIPPEIGNLSQLSLLLLSTNRLSGPIPPEIGQLASLEILNLDGNRFTGAIPAEIAGAQSLQFLGLEKNALTGELPEELVNLEQLNAVRLNFNALTAPSAQLLDFVNDRTDGEPFEDTQTVPPADVAVSGVTDRSAIVSWTPIRFDGNDGGYEVRATPAGGGSSIVSTTGSKRVMSHIIRGLSPETSYGVTVRTTSHPFGFQQNFLRSEPSTSVSFTTTERQTAPAEVDLVSGPAGLIQIGGVPQNEDSYVIGNFGDVATTITLDQEGDHFEQEPGTFVLEPGATQTVVLRSVPNQAPDSYWGHSFVTGDGVPDGFLVPVILLSTPPSVGTAIGEAVASRVDVFGLEGTDGVGTVRFRNLGSATLQGVLVSDSAWIRTAAEPITIPAGEVRSVSFDVIRHRRPLFRGAVNGSVRLVYVASGAGKSGPSPNDGSTGVSTTLVTVVDTVVPEARSSAIPGLEDGEVRRLIPGARHLARPSGTFVTDLSVRNAFGAGPLEDVEIFFDRIGSGDSSAASVGTLAPTTALVLANIVESVYGDDDRSGTIHLRSIEQERLVVEASLSNVAGPLGEMRGHLPVFRTDRAVDPGQSTYLMGVRTAPELETTIFVQESSGSTASVTIDYLRANGDPTGSMNLDLGRFELRELIGIVPGGTEVIRIANRDESSGALVAYGLVVDRATGSVATIVDWTSLLGYAPGDTVRIPIVISETDAEASTGAEVGVQADGSRRRAVRRPNPPTVGVRTSAFVMNPGSEEAVIDLTFYESTGTTYRQRRTVGAGAMMTIDDLVGELRGPGASASGYVVLDTLRGEPVVTAAVVRRVGASELVSALPVVADTDGLRLGQSVTFTGLEDSMAETVLAERPASFRTGFGITETEGRPVTVRATIGFAGKSPLVSSTFSKDFNLAARRTLVLRDMLRDLLGAQRDTLLGDMKNVQLTLTVIDGDGALTGFVQETENSSGDTRYLF